MKKLMFCLAACSLVALTACRKSDAEIYERVRQQEMKEALDAAATVCKAVNEKDAETLARHSHSSAEDFAATFAPGNAQPFNNCRDFSVINEFITVKFTCDFEKDGESVPKECLMTFYKQDGQWKSVQLDNAKALRQQIEQAKAQKGAQAETEAKETAPDATAPEAK